jgi:hypothetical protein
MVFRPPAVGVPWAKVYRELSVESIVARYNQVLSSVDYPDREVSVIPAADVTFG